MDTSRHGENGVVPPWQRALLDKHEFVDAATLAQQLPGGSLDAVSMLQKDRQIVSVEYQQKTHRPVQFEITDLTKNAASAWFRHSSTPSALGQIPNNTLWVLRFRQGDDFPGYAPAALRRGDFGDGTTTHQPVPRGPLC